MWWIGYVFLVVEEESVLVPLLEVDVGHIEELLLLLLGTLPLPGFV